MTTEQAAKATFRAHGGILRTCEALRLGIHPRTLYALRDAGELARVSRGVYRLSELPDLSEPDLVAVALRVPKAVVCLISALAFHDLTTEIPHEIQIALPRGTKAPQLDHPPLGVFWFSGDAMTAGVQSHELDEVAVKIYGPDKSVADAFKFRNKLGLDVALEALKRCLARGISPSRILSYARICRVERIILPYLEAALA